jgi:hypothetical protein
VQRSARKSLRRKKVVSASEDTKTTAPLPGHGLQYFKMSESKMNATTQLEKLSDKIADAIVALVNDKNGPVTFSEVEAEIPGFAKREPPTKGYALELRPGAEILIWGGMSEAGYLALRKIISGRRVAIQFVNLLPYIFDDYPSDDDWMPAMLLPARAANLETPRWLWRTSEYCRNYIMAKASAEKKAGYRVLTPTPLRFTADQFSW